MNKDEERKIVFFDSSCLLCHSFVQQIIKYNTSKTLQLAPLDGVTAKKALDPTKKLPDSVVYYNGQIFVEAEAVERITQHLEGPYRMLRGLNFFPKKLRNYVYRLVAANRYRVLPKAKSCPLPPTGEKWRFLP